MSARVVIDTELKKYVNSHVVIVRATPVPGAQEAYARRAAEVPLPLSAWIDHLRHGRVFRHPQFPCFPCIRRTGNTEHVHAFDLTSILGCQCRIVLDTSLV